MADVVHPVHGEVHRHPAPTGFIRKYVFSTDHKVIGIQYWSLALFAVFVGMGLSMLMRLQLAWPGQEWGFLKTLFPHAAENGTISGGVDGNIRKGNSPEGLACLELSTQIHSSHSKMRKVYTVISTSREREGIDLPFQTFSIPTRQERITGVGMNV